jgi:glycosyltransferase involved in cell wall biosynthesis
VAAHRAATQCSLASGDTTLTDEPSRNDDAAADDPRRLWSNNYVKEMESQLGKSVCRQLSIFSLPDDFVLSVIVPIYNENGTVSGVVERLKQTGIPMEIIMVDDGSTDGTSEALDEFQSVDGVKICHHPVNRGKGSAIQTGISMATGQIVVIQDADQEYDPNDFRFLLQPLLAGEADVAYGTRYGHCDRQLSPWWHQTVNHGISLLASIGIGLRLSDVETCYKMSKRENFETIANQLRERRFGIEIELTARWVRNGLIFTERPIRYRHRWYDEGKKIGWKDGLSALRCIVKYGFFRR